MGSVVSVVNTWKILVAAKRSVLRQCQDALDPNGHAIIYADDTISELREKTATLTAEVESLKADFEDMKRERDDAVDFIALQDTNE